MNLFNSVKRLLFVSFVLGLAGCYRSNAPLITAANADFPFNNLTYQPQGSSDPVKLERQGNRYVASNKKQQAILLMKSIGQNRYVVQVSAQSKTEMVHLFGVITVSEDRKTFSLTHSYVVDFERAAIVNAHEGLSPCKTPEGDMVCLAELDAFIRYVNATKKIGRETYLILEMN